MRAKALVPILAEIFGVPSETAFVIDRGLAEAGYRAKGKGRAWPEMTRVEAIHFLIACMTSTAAKGKVATRAAEDVALWATARNEIRVKYLRTSVEIETFNDEETVASRLVEDEYDRSKRLPFLKGMHGKTVHLVDYLLKLMTEIDRFSLFDITLTLSPSHFEASVRIHIGYDKFDKETFWVNGDPGLGPDFDQPGIRTDISVSGECLAAIAARTADPLAETAD